LNLIITSADRLGALYGRPGEQSVLSAIDRLIVARTARGVTSRLLMLEAGDRRLGTGPSATTAAIVQQVWAAATALKRAGDRLQSLLIIGGPDVVPFHEAPNPTPYDGDETVPGDWIYGARSLLAPLDWPVGRIPGPAGDDAAMLVRLIDFAAAAAGPSGPRKVFGYSTAAWWRAAEQVYAVTGATEPLLISPPVLAATLDRRRLDQAWLVYCNLHGMRDGPPWYGQAVHNPALVAALRPADLDGLDLRGTVVFSEACYGAAIDGRDADTSLALAFLARGASGFVGPTAMSYGPPAPPPGEADLIAQHFLRAIAESSTTLGDAFAAARAGMLRDTLARQRTLDEDDQKTLLEFVLYGDPTIVVSYCREQID
jgi:hypothetical protein